MTIKQILNMHANMFIGRDLSPDEMREIDGRINDLVLNTVNDCSPRTVSKLGLDIPTTIAQFFHRLKSNETH